MTYHATSLYRLLIALAVGFGMSAGVRAAAVSEDDHHAFERKYSAHCQEKEKENMAPGADLSAAAATCDCIAKEESKRLTSQEVKKYLKEDEVPISLIMKSTGATYNCTKQFP